MEGKILLHRHILPSISYKCVPVRHDNFVSAILGGPDIQICTKAKLNPEYCTELFVLLCRYTQFLKQPQYSWGKHYNICIIYARVHCLLQLRSQQLVTVQNIPPLQHYA